VNDDLEVAIARVSAIVDAEAARRTRALDLASRVGRLRDELDGELSASTNTRND
jgi:hypothetical protein